MKKILISLCLMSAIYYSAKAAQEEISQEKLHRQINSMSAKEWNARGDKIRKEDARKMLLQCTQKVYGLQNNFSSLPLEEKENRIEAIQENMYCCSLEISGDADFINLNNQVYAIASKITLQREQQDTEEITKANLSLGQAEEKKVEQLEKKEQQAERKKEQKLASIEKTRKKYPNLDYDYTVLVSNWLGGKKSEMTKDSWFKFLMDSRVQFANDAYQSTLKSNDKKSIRLLGEMQKFPEKLSSSDLNALIKLRYRLVQRIEKLKSPNSLDAEAIMKKRKAIDALKSALKERERNLKTYKK